jgi:ribosomal protein L24
MRPGDKVKIIRGPYKGKTGTLRVRITETDTRTQKREPCWIIWINGVPEMVYESEVQNGT